VGEGMGGGAAEGQFFMFKQLKIGPVRRGGEFQSSAHLYTIQ